MWHTTSRHARGYGKAWEKTRKRILERDSYLCQCRHCKAEGRTKVANEVDHIVSKARAKQLGWSELQTEADSNLGAINAACHRRKSTEEQGGTFKPKQRVGLDGWPILEKGGGDA
jgi:5-methylcytosine-specific restriction protein A